LPNIRFLFVTKLKRNGFGQRKGEKDKPTTQDVFDGDGKGVAKMETTIDGRGWQGDDKNPFRATLTIGSELGLKEAIAKPPVILARFERERVVMVGHEMGNIYVEQKEGENWRVQLERIRENVSVPEKERGAPESQDRSRKIVPAGERKSGLNSLETTPALGSVFGSRPPVPELGQLSSKCCNVMLCESTIFGIWCFLAYDWPV
jgi:hypothetical protein